MTLQYPCLSLIAKTATLPSKLRTSSRLELCVIQKCKKRKKSGFTGIVTKLVSRLCHI